MRKKIILILVLVLFLLILFLFGYKNYENKNILQEIRELELFSSDSENLSNEEFNIDYGDEYKKQFLDEIDCLRVSTHFGLEWGKDGEYTIEALKNLGISYVRDDIRWGIVQKEDGTFDFSETDKWINMLTENDISIQAVLGYAKEYQLGSDYKISNNDELEKFLEYVKTVMEQYPQITEYEIWNEPNGIYVTNEDLSWYSKAVIGAKEIAKSINPNIEIIVGSTMTPDTDQSEKRSSEIFIETISNYGVYETKMPYSFHLYDWDRSYKWNTRYKNIINKHKQLFNTLGGFTNYYITETGLPSTNNTEEEQAIMLVQQKVIWDGYSNVDSNTYNLRNMGETINIDEDNFGLVNYDYTPKQSFYAIKYYYENTNGAEYIGIVNLADGLEAHLYNKDGKPKIIAWANTNNSIITVPFSEFEVTDLYGLQIVKENEELEISNSPVYINNISDKYFYEAISNRALSGYSEFEEKFEAEIANINGLQEEINTLKQYMSSIANDTTEDENVAIEQMNTHFNLGNVILSAYKNGSLDVEYVKLSSMLDMLNDIGNSYEDLLTVCATTRAPYYKATEELINSAENKINNNSDLEIVYPSKILDFAKELDEKSEYINSLSEENDIKTGLIVSNSLHAYYLADWANEFASIYIDEYIEANPVTISYTNSTDWTNEDVVVTLNIGNDATVTNNGGSNTYTFRSNGSFTFEYERRGQAFTLEAKVSNIDKTYPTITGVKAGQTYTNSVKPVIEDTNLSIVSISYNGENIEYYDGITLEDEGMYSIVATDMAGNTTTVEFDIISEVQDNYIIQDNYLLNVWQETTLADFKKNYNSQESYIIKRNDTELTDADIIATGDTIELSSEDTYTIVVAGDINCDGKVTVFDLSALRRYILKQIEFIEIELLAADINLDYNEVGVMDYSRMRIEILEN